MSKAVVPLESDPAIFTSLGHGLGLPSTYEFTDIFSITDPDLKAFIPRPVIAMILLFPIDANYEALKHKEDSQMTPYQIPSSGNEPCYWFPQKVRNACGLYALLHSLCNATEPEPGSKLARFVDSLESARSFELRTELIELLENEYSEAAQEGQTKAPEPEEDIDLHFIAFVSKNGRLYELDGRRNGPLDLGPSGHDLIEEDVLSERVQKYMDIVEEKKKLRFSLMGLVRGG